jgi:peptide chain release factor
MTHLPTGIVVKSQATRSKSQNFTIARRILAEKIELLQKGPESRAAKKVERVRKKKASASKKSKRKYRKLAEEKEGAKDDEGEGDEDIRDIPEEVGSDTNIGAKP